MSSAQVVQKGQPSGPWKLGGCREKSKGLSLEDGLLSQEIEDIEHKTKLEIEKPSSV